MAYVVEYYCQFYDIGGLLNRIEILGLESASDSSAVGTAIEHPADMPVRIRHSGSKTDYKDDIIQAQELVFNFHIGRDDVDTFDAIFESDYKDYKIRWYLNGQLEFEGYIKPENLSRQFLKAPPYVEISLSANDALSDLKDVPFGNANIFSDKYTKLEVLKEALTPTGITKNFKIQLGTYESNYMNSDDCVLEEMKVDTRRFVEWKTGTPEIMSCWEVIESILKDYNVKLKQYKGYYQITNHYEEDSHEFEYDWSTLTKQSRTETDNILDVSSYDVDLFVEGQKIRPIKDVDITFRNKDLGGDVTGGMDLDDWSNAAIWTIDFSDGYSVLDNVVTLNSDDSSYDDCIETDTFGVTKVTDNDYLKVTFDHILSSYTSDDVFKASIVKITITRPDSSTEESYFPCPESWDTYESSIYKTFHVVATGNYSVKLEFKQLAGPRQWTTASFKLKNFRITKIVNYDDGSISSSVTYDEYYKQTSGQGIDVYETEMLFADGGQTTELGALIYEDSSEHLTSDWRTYGGSEDIPLLDIYARNILNDHYRFKNYLKLKIHDRNNNVGFNKILTINSRNYVFISYERDVINSVIIAELVELLTTGQDYGTIQISSLNSIDGIQASSSVAVSHFTAGGVPNHNQLSGLYGDSDYYHLSLGDHTKVGNLDTMAYQSTGNYYTASQINTWRNLVTQTEMGYLHGVTSDVQNQINARAVISGTPVNNRIAVWTGVTDIEGASGLQWTGAILTVGGNVKLGDANHLYLGAESDMDFYHSTSNYLELGANLYIRKKDTSENIAIFYPDGGLKLYYDNALKLETVTGGAEITGGVEHPSFVTGWFGNNWQIDSDGNVEIENLLVRASARFRELIIDQLSIIAGSNLMSIARGKVASIDTGNSTVTLEDPNNREACSFAVNDLFWIKTVDIDKNLFSDVRGKIVSISGITLSLSWNVDGSNGTINDISEGDVIVQRGSLTDEDRQALIYKTVSDADAPFERIMTGVDSLAAFSDLDNVVFQHGDLSSLASHDIVPASPGYGFYSDNAYLTGRIVLPNAGMTNEGDQDSDIRIYAGSAYADRATAPFRVEQSGDIWVNQIEQAVFKQDADNYGIKIQGGQIWENELDSDDGYIYVNSKGYNGGTTKYRNFGVGDGKGNTIFYTIGAENTLLLNSKIQIEGGTYILESVSAHADDGGWGQLWVKNSTPNQLWFTDDAGNDCRISAITSQVHGVDVTYNTLFDAMKDSIPVNGDKMLVTGGFDQNNVLYTASYAERIDSEHINVYAVYAGGRTSWTLDDGGESTLDNVSMAW